MDNAKNFKLMQVSDEGIGHSKWEDLITIKPTEKIEDVDLFQVISGRNLTPSHFNAPPIT